MTITMTAKRILLAGALALALPLHAQFKPAMPRDGSGLSDPEKTTFQNAIGIAGTAAIATQSEAEAGTENNKAMSPLRTKQAVDFYRAFATDAETISGIITNKLTTPAGVKAALDAAVFDAGSYLLANQSQSDVGESDDTVVSPLLNRVTTDAKFGRRLALPRIKTKIGAGQIASALYFGDSIAVSAISSEVQRQLWGAFEWAGVWAGPASVGGNFNWSFNQDGAAGGGSIEEEKFDYSPTGQVFLLNGTDEFVSFGDGTYAHDTHKLIIATEPGGGTYRIQRRQPGGLSAGWVDVPGYEAMDASAGSLTLVALPAITHARGTGNMLRVQRLTGTVRVIGDLITDSQRSAGLIQAAVHLGGLDMTDADAITSANLAVILGVIQPDLVTWSFKDGAPGGYAAKLTATQALWDAAYATDWLFLAPYPDATYATAQEARSVALPVFEHAIANGHDYFDLTTIIPTYAFGVAQGWYADVTHTNAIGGSVMGDALWRASGLFEARLANQSRPVNTTSVRTSALTIGNRDVVAQNRLARNAVAVAGSGLSLGTGAANYLSSSPARASEIDAGSLTVMGWVRVRTAPTTASVPWFWIIPSSGNGKRLTAEFEFSTQRLTVSIRNAADSASLLNRSPSAGADFHGKAGNWVFVCIRRNAIATTEWPFQCWIDGVKYALTNGVTGTGLEDLAGTNFRIGSTGGNSAADGLDIGPHGVYLSALPDAQILAAYESAQLPVGAEVSYGLREGYGGTAASANGYVGNLTGSATWLAPRVPAPRIVTTATATLRENEPVTVNRATLSTLTLPAAPKLGSRIPMTGLGAGGWRIAQPAGHQIVEGAGGTVGTNATTAGTGGHLSSGARYDSVTLECIVSDSVTPSYIWSVVSARGTLAWN